MYGQFSESIIFSPTDRPNIKIPVMSAAQVSEILILTQILVGQTIYAKNRSCIAGKEHE